MGRNRGSKTGVIVTIPVTCQQCGTVFQVPGKRRPDGPKPARYCSRPCYAASRKGIRPDWLIGTGGAPKGREPWNKGKKCPQLAGEHNGMFGRTHTPEIREMLSRLTSSQLSELTIQRLAGAQAPMRRSDPEYTKIFRVGWLPIRRKALERDGYACRVCGAAPKRLNVHHIVPFGLVLEHQLDNLITLCESCHTRVHRGALALAGAAEPVLEDVGPFGGEPSS